MARTFNLAATSRSTIPRSGSIRLSSMLRDTKGSSKLRGFEFLLGLNVNESFLRKFLEAPLPRD